MRAIFTSAQSRRDLEGQTYGAHGRCYANSLQAGRRKRQSGTELVEFTLTLLPFLCILFVLLDASWAIFVKATLQYAVRTGVRTGITITGTQATAAGETLTQMVKDTVQNSALGILAGTTGRSYIQVHYFEQDLNSSTGVTDVSTQSTGNAPGNLMQVSVNNFRLAALLPRIYGWFVPVDKNPTIINVASADKIEPSGDTPPIGTAP
jgi:Flp pilus assembly protein TadG